MGAELRLYDHRSGESAGLPPRRLLRIALRTGGLRAVVAADLLRRVAGRQGRRVDATYDQDLPGDDDWTDFNVLPFSHDLETPEADLHVTSAPIPERCVVVPEETGDWRAAAVAGDVDPLAARLALLEVRYRERLELDRARLLTAAYRLDGWRSSVAGWATNPGRPMDRAYAEEAESALADDLDSPSALAVLDRLADDPEIEPGAKLETFIHLDLLLALDMVRDIGKY